jgi:hypothetical protein
MIRQIDVEVSTECPAQRGFSDLPRPEEQHALACLSDAPPDEAGLSRGSFTS